jgi:hypothetical protein
MAKPLPRLQPDLGCAVLNLSIDFVAKSGKLFVPDSQCTDMGRTIDLFTKVFPEIKLIETFAGDKEDTKYYCHDGNWEAFSIVA